MQEGMVKVSFYKRIFSLLRHQSHPASFQGGENISNLKKQALFCDTSPDTFLVLVHSKAGLGERGKKKSHILKKTVLMVLPS